MKLILSTLPMGRMVKRTMETKAAAQKLRKDLRAMYPMRYQKKTHFRNHTALKNPNQLKSISSGQGWYPVSMTNAYIMAKAEREG